MTKVNLYRYEKADGSYIITPKDEKETDTPYAFRLIADEDKVLTDGINTMPCIDTHTPDNYWEIDDGGDTND